MIGAKSPQYYVAFPIAANPKSMWSREPGFFNSLDEAITYVKETCATLAFIHGVATYHGMVCDRDTDKVVYAQ